MESLNVFQPNFLELVFLELCLHYKTIEEQPMDTFCPQFFFFFFFFGGGGGRGSRHP